MERLKQLIERYVPIGAAEEKEKAQMLAYLEQFPDILTRENTLCHFTASSWIVNKERTKVLMIYHNIYDSWAWTGGHADGDANLCAVAIKEAKEETGLANVTPVKEGIYALQILTVESHYKRGEYVAPHLHLDCCFLLEADEAEMLTVCEAENSGVAWFPLEDATKVTKEEKMRPIYQKLNDRI